MARSEPKPKDLSNWFIGVGIVFALGLAWFAAGQPGIRLRDGDYGCSIQSDFPIHIGGPGATVEDGEVVDVWDFNMRTGTKKSLPWSDAKRENPKEFSVRAAAPGTNARTAYEFVCTAD